MQNSSGPRFPRFGLGYLQNFLGERGEGPDGGLFRAVSSFVLQHGAPSEEIKTAGYSRQEWALPFGDGHIALTFQNFAMRQGPHPRDYTALTLSVNEAAADGGRAIPLRAIAQETFMPNGGKVASQLEVHGDLGALAAVLMLSASGQVGPRTPVVKQAPVLA